jgi:hypothetical protein
VKEREREGKRGKERDAYGIGDRPSVRVNWIPLVLSATASFPPIFSPPTCPVYLPSTLSHDKSKKRKSKKENKTTTDASK